MCQRRQGNSTSWISPFERSRCVCVVDPNVFFNGNSKYVPRELTFNLGELALIHQYEGAMKYIYQLTVWAQPTLLSVGHAELFELISALENLGQQFFLTYNDVLKGTGEQHAPDLTV